MSTNKRFPGPKVTGDPVLAEKFLRMDDVLFTPEPPPLNEEAMRADAEAFITALASTGIQASITCSIANNPAVKRRAREAEQANAYPSPMTSAELKRTVFPPQRFLLDKLIMEGIPQTLDGDGGIGKSKVAIGASVAIGAGKPIFGKKTIRGPVLFVTHEDTLADLQTTAKAYADYLDVELEALPVEWWSLLENDITLAIVDDKGEWKPGPFYKAFEARLRQSPRGLFVVLDCRSDVVQMNEVLREPPNTFYKTILTPLCKLYDCTILVLCHPSKASMATGAWYSGGTGNKSALRNKLVMKLEDESAGANPNGPRILDVLKRNMGARDRSGVRLSFDVERGIFVADDDAAVQEDQRAIYETVVKAVLELIDKGVNVVRNAQAAGSSPKDVATYINRECKPETAITPKQVKAMLTMAEQCGALRYVKGYGKTAAHYERAPIE